VAESCDGASAACPADGFAGAGSACRVAAGACDVEEACDGSSAACPADVKSTAECRAAAGACDLAEACDGVADDCPSDLIAGAGTVCRAAASACDVEETCDGTAITCPADATDDGDGDAVCDDDDLCPTASDPANLDRDDDGKGDACDPCTNLYDIFATKARIKLTKLDTLDGNDGLGFKGTLDGVPLDPTIDPAANGVRVIVENESPGGAFVDVTIPGGVGWKVNKKATAWTYSNPTGFEGLTKVKIKAPAKVPGQFKFKVKGKNMTFGTIAKDNAIGTLILSPPLAVDGQCGEAVFPNAQGGACKTNKKGSKVTCR
jgi:hypothetical protein